MSERRREILADGVEVWLGDMREILPTLGPVDHVICDPPYEAVMQSKWGVLHVDRFAGMDGGAKRRGDKITRYQDIGFEAIDEMREDVAKAICAASLGWAILFCMAEGVRAWRDAIEATGVKYKRALVWVKPDAMPQFNGRGPSVGHEMLVSAWCGPGHSKWNGGGRPGTFVFNKNTPGGGEHPTQKPEPLMREIVSLFSSPGELVADPFCGSGTTGIAAVKLGRRFIGIERDPSHFDLSVRRISDALRQPDFFVEKPKPVKQEAFI